MSEKSELPVPVPRLPIATTSGPVEQEIHLRQADRWMKKAGYKKLKAIKLRARGKVGKFIEQEGEHHIARSSIASTLEELEDLYAICEERLAKAMAEKNAVDEDYWINKSLRVLSQMNKASGELASTRRKAAADEDANAAKVPTMPARTVITNNTQIVVQQPKPE